MAQLNEKEMELAALICEGCTTPAELTAKLKNLFSGALEKLLEPEMDEHLGYEKHSVLGNNSGNSRNGYSKRQSRANGAKVRSVCRAVGTAPSSRKQSKRDKPAPTT